MPRRIVEYACIVCDGRGGLENDCPVCAKPDGVTYHGEFTDIHREQKVICPRCGLYWAQATRKCVNCGGTGKVKKEAWIPESLDETCELLSRLKPAPYLVGSGAWRILDDLRFAYDHCKGKKRGRLFPENFLGQLSSLESELPPRCSQCKGRATDSITGITCTLCSESGYGKK